MAVFCLEVDAVTVVGIVPVVNGFTTSYLALNPFILSSSGELVLVRKFMYKKGPEKHV